MPGWDGYWEEGMPGEGGGEAGVGMAGSGGDGWEMVGRCRVDGVGMQSFAVMWAGEGKRGERVEGGKEKGVGRGMGRWEVGRRGEGGGRMGRGR